MMPEPVATSQAPGRWRPQRPSAWRDVVAPPAPDFHVALREDVRRLAEAPPTHPRRSPGRGLEASPSPGAKAWASPGPLRSQSPGSRESSSPGRASRSPGPRQSPSPRRRQSATPPAHAAVREPGPWALVRSGATWTARPGAAPPWLDPGWPSGQRAAGLAGRCSPRPGRTSPDGEGSTGAAAVRSSRPTGKRRPAPAHRRTQSLRRAPRGPARRAARAVPRRTPRAWAWSLHPGTASRAPRCR